MARAFPTLVLATLAAPIPVRAWERGKVQRFATLPAGEAHPEGICVGRDGNVYVVTVAATKPETSEGTILVFRPNGKHLRTMSANWYASEICCGKKRSLSGNARANR